jgi:hypothetical protein
VGGGKKGGQIVEQEKREGEMRSKDRRQSSLVCKMLHTYTYTRCYSSMENKRDSANHLIESVTQQALVYLIILSREIY